MSSLVFLMCLFNALNAQNTDVINLARYVITQNDLNINGTRFNGWTENATKYLNAASFPPPFKVSWGRHHCSYLELGLSSMHFTINKTSDVVHKIRPRQIDILVDVTANLDGFWKMRDKIYVFFCLDYWFCNSHWSADMKVQINVTVDIYFDPKKGGAYLKPNTTFKVNSAKLIHCDFDIHEEWCLIIGTFLAAIQYITNWVIDLILGEIWGILTAIFATMTVDLQSTHQLSMYDGVQLTYWYTGLEAVNNSHIALTSSGTLSAQIPSTGKWLNYSISKSEANIDIPSNLPVTNGSISNDPSTYFLNDLRLTSTVLQGIVWAAQQRNELNPKYNFTCLDSTFLFNVLWGYPKIDIPKNGTVSFAMPYGFSNGTCWHTEANTNAVNASVVLQFNFTDLLSYGTVVLEGDIHDQNITLAFQFDSIDTSLLKPYLIAPDIPLPANIVQNMMILLINNSISLLNSWSATHSIDVPPSFLQYITAPLLDIIHEAGCCNGTHGYLDFATMCSCGGSTGGNGELLPACPTCQKNDLWAPSHDYTCDTPPGLFEDNKYVDLLKSTEQYGVWFYIYSSQNQEDDLFDLSCNTKNMDDDLIMLQLANTNGACMKSPVTISSNYSTQKYYSLNMTDKYHVTQFSAICNDTGCSQCVYQNDEGNINMGYCYPTEAQNIHIMFELFDNNSTTPACIGGNDDIDKNDVIITVFNNTKICAEEVVIIQRNIGPIKDSCTAINNGSFYAILETIDAEKNQYLFKDQCKDAQCTNCSFPMNVSMNECNWTDVTITYDESYIFQFGDQVSICGDKLEHKQHVNYGLTVGIIVGVICGLFCILFHVNHYRKNNEPYWSKCVTCSKACCIAVYQCNYKAALRICCLGIKDQIVSILVWIRDSFISPKIMWSAMDDKEKIHSFLLLIMAFISFLTWLMWLIQSPWKIFDEEGFEYIGVPADSLDITNLTSTLNKWETECQFIFMLFFVVFLLSFLAQFCIRRQPFGCNWKTFRVILILCYIHLTFLLVFILFPTFYSFTDAVKLNPDDDNTFTGSSDIQDDANTFIGYGFSGVFLTFFSNVILYFIVSIPVGIYIISLLFIRQLFNDDVNYNINNQLFNSYKNINITEKMISVKNSIFHYYISRDNKSGMISRIIVLLFVIESMALCVESLPVIIMYQSFGTSYAWIILWIIWWILPLLLLYHIWKQCQIFIQNDKNPDIINRCKRHVTWNARVTMVMFVVIAVGTIICEAHYTQISVWFTSVSCFTGLISGSICWLFIMHFMFESMDSSNDKKQNLMNAAGDSNNTVITNVVDGSKSKSSGKSKPRRFEDSISKSIRYEDDKISLVPSIYETNRVCLGSCGKSTCWGLWYFLFEGEESSDTVKYGPRAIGRRFLLFFGTICYGYISIKSFVKLMGQTTKEMVVNFVNSLDWDVSWPSDNNGGTLFDNLFHNIDITRKIASVCGLIGMILFMTALLFDILDRSRVGLRKSKKLGWTAAILVFASIFTPVLPNYLSFTPIQEICPKCGPEFNRAIELLLGDCIGLFCAGIFILEMLPIAIGTVIPAVVRSGFVVLHKSKVYRLNKIERDTVNYVMIVGAMLVPYITFIPLLCYQQFEGNWFVGLVLIIFWILPFFISFKIKSNDAYYYLYLGMYYSLIIMIIIYHCIRFGLPDWLKKALLNPEEITDFIIEVIAEVSLTLVLLSDFIYTIILGLRHDN